MTRRRRGPTPAKPWTPLVYSHSILDRHVFGNNRYTVTLHLERVEEWDDDVIHLSIHTHTRGSVGAHDWRHFQRIKNELCGPDRTGIEVFPPEDELVDTSNEYHLWVLPEGWRLPFTLGPRMTRDSVDPPISEDDELRAAAVHMGLDPERVVGHLKKKSKQRALGG